MKKILFSLLNIIVISGIVAGSTYAIFSGQATSQNNTFSVGNANLEIKNTKNGGWSGSLTGAQFQNLYPGWENEYDLYFRNVSNAPISLKVFPYIKVKSTTNYSLLDVITMKFTWSDGTHSTDSKTLREWLDPANSSPFNTPIAKDEEQGPWVAKFSVSPEAGNDIKNSNFVFDVIFDGRQVL